MAFAEGERNISLRLLADINRVCPDQYVMMLRERHARELANTSRAEQLDAIAEPSYGPSHPDYPTDDQLAEYDTFSRSFTNGRHDTFGPE
jgi:hypothetical protein